jgi:hypothetical protein
MGPHQLNGKDNLLSTILSFIDGAQKKLNIAVQELDCKPIAEAIIKAKKEIIHNYLLQFQQIFFKILIMGKIDFTISEPR